MKTKIPPSKSLEQWLFSPQMEEFLGPTAVLKLDVLATIKIGGNLAECGRRNGTTRQACYMIARDVRRVFNIG